MSDYRPWDREEKLGPVPEGGFKPDDPKVRAWEDAHGHDLRLKCLPEFGCLVLQERTDRIEDAAQALVGGTYNIQWLGGRPHVLVPQNLVVRLLEALA